MAMERSTAEALPLPPRLSASPTSSPATVGALLTNAACASRIRRECRSPRSLLSRILGRGSGGFGCRMRIPRYCSSGAGAAAKEDAVEEEVAAAAPKVVMESKQETEARQSPRSSLQGMKVAPEVSAASLGLGAGLVLLLSRGAAELSRMAELRAQMERLVLDVRAEARGSTRSDLSGGGHADDGASVVKERIVFSDAGGGEDASLSRGSRDAASACGDAGVVNAAAAMDQMEAELEAELTRLQLDSDDDDEEECVRPRQGHQLESEAKSDISSESGSLACVHIDGVLGDAARDCKEHEDNEEEEEEEEEGDTDEEDEESKPCHGGVPACVLERRLHELLQSRHEQRIAELETELQRAQKKLRDKEREVSRWRDTAKLVSRHKDESRLR